jgi:serine/threonine protein kinase
MLEEIGCGSFSKVHAVRPLHSAEAHPVPLAVKVIDLTKPDPDSPAGDLKEKQDLLRHYRYRRKAAVQEAWILEMLATQANCVKLAATFADRKTAYLVMERCDRTLFAHLSQMPRLSEQTLPEVFQQMCRAVSQVHGVGIVHRDVKPDNFMCQGPDAKIVLLDFGFACFTGPDPVRGVIGTAPFMSPEMLCGNNAHNVETDVWALGTILHVLLLGEFPHMPAEMEPDAMKVAIRTGKPSPRFSQPDSGVSPEAKDLLRRLLDRRQHARLTASKALKHRWMRPTSEPRRCLREMLDAAVDIGAFSAMHPAQQDDSDLEVHLLSGSPKDRSDTPDCAEMDDLRRRRDRWLPTIGSAFALSSGSCDDAEDTDTVFTSMSTLSTSAKPESPMSTSCCSSGVDLPSEYVDGVATILPPGSVPRFFANHSGACVGAQDMSPKSLDSRASGALR